MKLISIQQLMTFYSRQKEVLHPITEAQMKFIGKETHSMLSVSNREMGLQGIAHHYFSGESGVEIGIYINDDSLHSKCLDRMFKPLDTIADCNYTYYGCLLNLMAYITERPIHRLFFVHMKDDNKITYIQYRKVLAELLVNHFDKHYRKQMEQKLYPEKHKDQFQLI